MMRNLYGLYLLAYAHLKLPPTFLGGGGSDGEETDFSWQKNKTPTRNKNKRQLNSAATCCSELSTNPVTPLSCSMDRI